jgi:hypothetical protein
VRELLAGLQRPRRERRTFARLTAQVRASLRHAKAVLREQLAPLGIQLKGSEFRGQRRALAVRPTARTHLPFIPRRL